MRNCQFLKNDPVQPSFKLDVSTVPNLKDDAVRKVMENGITLQ